ncbi:hypothetical protein B0813_001060 [Candidatus Fervidibacteria bacterium JGI MDM2 SSWTFF-3-K9]
MSDFIDDAELTKAMLDWMFERLDAEKELLWATLERTREGFDLELILSIIHDFTDCLPTFAENETAKNAHFP